MKLLIFMEKSLLKPVGGPAGYLYTLYKEDKDKKLTFLSSSNGNNKQVSGDKKNSFKTSILDELRTIKHILIGNRSEEIESNDYDLIHFHRTSDVYKFRKSLRKYKGITVLTSHCPTLGAIETYDSKKTWEKILFWPVYMFSLKADKKSFGLVDYIIFPCREAEEPYAHAWDGFARFKKENLGKFKYLLTGTDQRNANVSKEDIRKKYNIPLDAKVICYVGRHNRIKGYDHLKELSEHILELYPECYIIVAGKEEPLTGLNHPRWIEVGWTNDPHSIINASDIFVLPNRETYFDLVLLEVLSLGTIPMISNTGGNKYFDKEKYKGVFVYHDDNDFFIKVKEILDMNDEQIQILRQHNRDIFKHEFDATVFYKNYLKIIDECLKDKK